MNKRRRDLDSIKRYANWTSKAPWEGYVRWSGGPAIAEGPVIELELGIRSASYFLHTPSSGPWRNLWMSK